jgi:hypothetical protein
MEKQKHKEIEKKAQINDLHDSIITLSDQLLTEIKDMKDGQN